MNRTEHLLTILAEEGVEIAQRATKAARFGLEECEPGQALNNSVRILDEVAVLEMLCEDSVVFFLANRGHRGTLQERIDAKKKKVEHYLKYSAQRGTLQ